MPMGFCMFCRWFMVGCPLPTLTHTHIHIHNECATPLYGPQFWFLVALRWWFTPLPATMSPGVPAKQSWAACHWRCLPSHTSWQSDPWNCGATQDFRIAILMQHTHVYGFYNVVWVNSTLPNHWPMPCAQTILQKQKQFELCCFG